jgi:hypothetical protein
VTGNAYRCRTCKRGSPYVFCSNDCFREYPTKKSHNGCATCSARGSERGNLESNRLCPNCNVDPANREWVRTPRHEYNGFDLDVFEAANGGIEAFEPRPYRGKTAILIVRMIAGGIRYREISELLECSMQYVDKVATYWNKETDGLLRSIRKAAQSR